MSLIHLSEVHRQLGDQGRALEAARAAADMALRCGGDFHLAHGRVAEARALLMTDVEGSRTEIESALESAERLVREIEARSLEPQIFELRGRLAQAMGDRAAGERLLRDSLALYRRIGATGHADRLARDLGA